MAERGKKKEEKKKERKKREKVLRLARMRGLKAQQEEEENNSVDSINILYLATSCIHQNKNQETLNITLAATKQHHLKTKQ